MVRGRRRTNASDAHSDPSSVRAGTSVTTGPEDYGMSSERQALIMERQGELEKVLNKHDDLVREAFHLERFVTLLRYDPVVAKEDRTPVFLEYKANYDLVMKTPGSGPSRTTRRAQNERVSALKNQSKLCAPPSSQTISAPIASSSRTTSPSATSISAAPKRKTVRNLSAVAKGKQKESVSDEEADISLDMSIGQKAHMGKVQAGPKVKAKQKDATGFPAPTSRGSRSRPALLEGTSSIPISNPRSTRLSKRLGEDDAGQPSKKIRLTPRRSAPDPHATEPPLPTKSAPSDALARPRVSGKTVAGKTLPSSKLTANLVRPTIKRVRLIVREPPPMISSPLQRPRPSRFGRSLPALLASYVEIDGREHSVSDLEYIALRDARILHKVESLKKKGRMLGRSTPTTGASPSAHRPSDVWATIVAEAIAVRNALPRHRFGRGGIVGSAIHTRLLAYWETMKTREEREAAAEEKRRRALAKTILRLVLGEWRKVVYHVREEERRVLEVEEKRRGRQHLDAILDQSGQILEKQQMELVRTDLLRSRSGTVSVDGEEMSDEDDMDDMDDISDEGEDAVRGLGVDEVEEASDGGDMEISDVGSDVEEFGDVDSSALIPGHMEGPREDRYTDFTVPLNDIDVQDERATTESSTQDLPSLGDETGEDANEEDFAQSELNFNNDGNVSELLDHTFDEDVYSVDQDVRTNGFADVDSSGTSLESTPSMDDLHVHGHYTPRMGLDIDRTLGGFRSSTLQSIHDFEHDSPIETREKVLERQPSSLPNVSKPHFTSVVPSPEPIGASGNYKEHVANGVGARPELLNGNRHDREDGTTAQMEPNYSQAQVVDDIISVKVNDSSVDAHADILPDVKAHLLRETLDDVANASSGNGKEVHLTDGQAHIPDVSAQNEVIPTDNDLTNADDGHTSEPESEWEAPAELQPYAVARVNWSPDMKLVPPLLLRGTLRPYQQSGLEWLASLHNNNMNGILADEMGLGKTIQTIALLAHLACDRGIWGPHLIIVPTSVLLNWEMEFKKFLPGFKILSYHGTTKRRKELRQGWNNKHAFNVCVTSYTLASRDQHIFKRKAWYYMILDEAHMIKNFKSQRWNILLMFRSLRRLLLTGTPLQNNLTELWALLQFLMSGSPFANLKDFGEWFSTPLEKAIEQGNVQDEEVQAQVAKLHTVLRPYLLRRLKRDVEKELPSKYEHLVLCRLSKRQRFLYDEFMSRNQTRNDLKSGVYQKIANILMQLRKVCNHPDLFEVRPIVTSFAMDRSAIADFEIKELLIRRRFHEDDDEFSHIDFDVLGLQLDRLCNTSLVAAQKIQSLEEILASEVIAAYPGEPPPQDTRTIEGYLRYNTYQQKLATYERYKQMLYLNRLRCNRIPIYGLETINIVKQLYNPLRPVCEAGLPPGKKSLPKSLIKSYISRERDMGDIIDRFAFATPPAVARDLPRTALREIPAGLLENCSIDLDATLHRASVKLQIAFPDASLLQYDCGKLQELATLLRERKAGGHRVLIFTQMTRILDILEALLNYHGYLYLRLDGATKIEDRQYITERFNVDERIFAFIASSRSGGVGINLTGADTVIFYDSDFNPQMDRQCEDRAHRIGQIRDVHIYRFISQYTVEEAMLRKANQKRSLDDIVIQQGEFDWRNFFRPDEEGQTTSASALQKALVEFEDFEDSHAARVAASEEAALQGEDRADFGDADTVAEPHSAVGANEPVTPVEGPRDAEPAEDEDEEAGTTIDYMLKAVRTDREYFREWKQS
ncbi:hypothetical protein M0805_009083 [Coniferiporia weirii]|nr:hypothetical protein M0805_009083 [Coniferiporia weirii]